MKLNWVGLRFIFQLLLHPTRLYKSICKIDTNIENKRQIGVEKKDVYHCRDVVTHVMAYDLK